MSIQIEVPNGSYVVAVSGGVDSMALLALLVELANSPNTNLRLTVAHFDHGIRPDSVEDRKLVQRIAQKYSLPFVYDEGSLGPEVSEAVAREARYAFLRTVQTRAGADAIMTAHHRDDVLETLIINWLRGTKSRGLSSLRSTKELQRPLLGYTKSEIREYATAHALEWREDSTNEDESYLRNYVRRQLIPKLGEPAKQQLLAHSDRAAELNETIQELVTSYLHEHTTPSSIGRTAYRALPDEVSLEVLAAWLRKHVPAGITAKLLARLDTALRTGRNNSFVDIEKGYRFHLQREVAVLISSQ